MGLIAWNTDVNAPCCPGEIVWPRYRDDWTGRFTNDRILIQTDWECPAVATNFGWSLSPRVQRCPVCKHVQLHSPDVPFALCEECGGQYGICPHDHTDGTVICDECGVTASDFISAAYDWLRDHDGVTASDPGYFD